MKLYTSEKDVLLADCPEVLRPALYGVFYRLTMTNKEDLVLYVKRKMLDIDSVTNQYMRYLREKLRELQELKNDRFGLNCSIDYAPEVRKTMHLCNIKIIFCRSVVYVYKKSYEWSDTFLLEAVRLVESNLNRANTAFDEALKSSALSYVGQRAVKLYDFGMVRNYLLTNKEMVKYISAFVEEKSVIFNDLSPEPSRRTGGGKMLRRTEESKKVRLLGSPYYEEKKKELQRIVQTGIQNGIQEALKEAVQESIQEGIQEGVRKGMRFAFGK
jgi:hypothetical protein